MFVILGIIIVVVIATGFFLRENISKSISEMKIGRSVVLKQQSADATRLVENCLNYVGEEAVLKVAAQGGLFYVSRPIAYESYNVPIYYNKGIEKVPEISDLEKSISEYINANIQACAGNFQSLKFTASPLRPPDASVVLGESINFDLDWPVRIGDEEQATVSEYSAEADINLRDAYQQAIGLYGEQKEKQLLSLTDLAKLAREKDYLLHFDFRDDAIVFILTFNEIKAGNSPIVYAFAIIPKENAGQYMYEGIDFTEFFLPPEGEEEEQELEF